MNFRQLIASRLLASIFAVALLLPGTAFAEKVNEEPTMLTMGADLLVVRPVMLGVTVLGMALYTVTLPFSLLGGNSGQVFETMVLGPAETTFVRCLGCTTPGYNSGQ